MIWESERTDTEKAADGWEYTIIDDEPPSFWADAAKHGIHLVIGIRASDTDPDEEAPEHPEDDRQQVRASSFKDWNVQTSKHQNIGTRKRRNNMTNESEGYHIEGPDKDGMYSCEDCGHWFTVPEGEPVECPICKQLRNYEPLRPCPFCGSDSIVLDWDMRDPERCDNHHQIQARCMGCSASTDLFDTAAEAAARWNRRPYTKRYKSNGLEPCPFCAGTAAVEKFRDYTLDTSYNAAYYHVALCTECGNRAHRSDDMYDVDTTIEAWNRRVEE